MFIAGNFINAIATLIDMILNLAMWLIIIRALLSWVSPDPYNPIVQFLYRATDPILLRIQRVLPPMGGIDLSPIIAIFVIIFLQSFLVGSLYGLARTIGLG